MAAYHSDELLDVAAHSPGAVSVVVGEIPKSLERGLQELQGRHVVRAHALDAALPPGAAAAQELYLVVERGQPLWHVRRWVDQLRTSGRNVLMVALVDPRGWRVDAPSDS